MSRIISRLFYEKRIAISFFKILNSFEFVKYKVIISLQI